MVSSAAADRSIGLKPMFWNLVNHTSYHYRLKSCINLQSLHFVFNSWNGNKLQANHSAQHPSMRFIQFTAFLATQTFGRMPNIWFATRRLGTKPFWIILQITNWMFISKAVCVHSARAEASEPLQDNLARTSSVALWLDC
jgi:hypothetical protein